MTNTIYHIYKHTSKTSGKSYIGVTNNIRKRWNAHRCKVNKDSHYQFHKAWRKYGEQDWITEILYSSKDKEHVYLQEIYFICKFNTYINGYNGTPGGIVPPAIIGKGHWLYSKTHSDETKKKIRKNHADCSGAKNSMAKHIWLKSPDGVLHTTYGTLKNFCKNNNLSYGTAYKQLKQHIKPLSGSFVGWKIWLPTNEEIEEEFNKRFNY